MARFKKNCRVCGKSYEACRTPGVPGVFRWQEVACCPEHGAEYLTKLNAARGVVSPVEPEVEVTTKHRNKKARFVPEETPVITIGVSQPSLESETAEVVSETETIGEI